MRKIKLPVFKTKVTENEILYGGIYLLSINNEKVYVGQASKTFLQRWLSIECYILFNNKTSKVLNSLSKQYNVSSFEWHVLEYIPNELHNDWIELNKLHGKERTSPQTRQKYKTLFSWLDEKEKYWIAFYRNNIGRENVLNISDGGKGTNGCYFPRSKESLIISGKNESKTVTRK